MVAFTDSKEIETVTGSERSNRRPLPGTTAVIGSIVDEVIADNGISTTQDIAEDKTILIIFVDQTSGSNAILLIGKVDVILVFFNIIIN